MHNKTAASRYYVQNIIGAPLYDPHIPPEHLATVEPVTNCLKETVGIEDVHLLGDLRSRSVLKKWSGLKVMKLKSEM